jgi:hypothetical protein
MRFGPGLGLLGRRSWECSWLNESRDWVRLACIGLIISGVVGLKAVAQEAGVPPTDKAVARRD